MKTRTECLKQYGSDYLIRKRLESGQLFRVGKAIYSEYPYVPELVVYSYKYPNAVITMQSAFYLHGLTDVIPELCDFATDRNAAKIRDNRIRQFFLPSNFFRQGIEKIDYKGYQLPIYSKERMLIELMRYKTKLSYDYYKEILLNYRRLLPRLNIQLIQDYALVAPKSNRIMTMLQMEVM